MACINACVPLPVNTAMILTLMDKSDVEILEYLNHPYSDFEEILRRQLYTDSDLEILMSLISKACSCRNCPDIFKLLKKVDRYRGKFLLTAVPNMIFHAINEKCDVNLPELTLNYFFTIKTMVKLLDATAQAIENILPQLQYMVNQLVLMNVNNAGRILWEMEHIERVLTKRREKIKMVLNETIQPPGDFRKLSIVPRKDDVIECPTPYLRRNIVDGPYDDVEHYLDVQFRLMREDMMRAFRSSIKIFRKDLSNCVEDVQSGRLYTEVRFKYPPEYTINGVSYTAIINCSSPVRWKESKCLKPGSLVCLTYDRFVSITFATIKDKHPVSDYGKECQLKMVVEHANEEINHRMTYEMFETDAYFEPYRHVLQTMKELNAENFPFADCITKLNFENTEAAYLKGIPFCLHEKCPDSTERSSENDHPCKTFNVLDLDQWPSADELKLDENQVQAFQAALTKKLALIQGPPGTGKTFLGAKIVKALLENVPNRPIVICCQTNQSLDQFLALILKYSQKVVRLGLQSKSEVIDPYILWNMIDAVLTQRNVGQIYTNSMNEIKMKSLKIAQSIVPNILTNSQRFEADSVLPYLRQLCSDINELYSSYVKCKKKYFDDGILNKIIDSSYKGILVAGSGSSGRILSKCVIEWLMLYKKPTDIYEQCEEIWEKLASIPEDKSETTCVKDVSLEETVGKNLWRIPTEERFTLFYHWRNQCLSELRSKLKKEKANYLKMLERRKKPLHHDTTLLLKGADIIGMTTTGASKFKDYVRAVKPRVMIVEEAAEVLESHIITSLVSSIEHLILIGDHEQLRPVPTDYELSKDYNLNFSLFERLFMNGAPSVSLKTQHRMRPVIANLLVPGIYTTLNSHQSVYQYEDIIGVASNVFFIKHTVLEDIKQSYRISTNEYEAKYIAMLCGYLILQGYDQSQITILTAYSGQVPVILRHIDFELTGLQVTTVDNYQGEENDIILISFVRSNTAGVMGFLAKSNRVCVALSRARKGLYCIGNFDMFAKNNKLWDEIVDKLVLDNLIGTEFPLQCRNHKGEIIHVQDMSEFKDFVVRGCGVTCDYVLPCGHRCVKDCHFDDAPHTDYICGAPCERTVEINDGVRVCHKLCWEQCVVKKKSIVKLLCEHEVSCSETDIDLVQTRVCKVEIQKMMPCGHFDTLPCQVDANLHKCRASVPIILECGHKRMVACHLQDMQFKIPCHDLVACTSPCGHTVEIPCSESEVYDKFVNYCVKSCEVTLNCGDPCTGLCRTCSLLGIHAMCSEPCDLMLSCGHECEGTCGAPCPPCSQPCLMQCTHSYCVNSCARVCVKCTEPCTWRCEHHTCKRECWQECEERPCDEACVKTLFCGHACIGFCGEPCPYLCRICNVQQLDSPHPESDRFVMLGNCEHVVEVKRLSNHIENSISIFEWPYCPICFTGITTSARFNNQLEKAKAAALRNADVKDEVANLYYLLHTMFGLDYVVTWRFTDIHEKMLRILEHKKHSLSVLTILKHCVLAMKELVGIETSIVACQVMTLEERFDDLLFWISKHLEQASFQQFEELFKSVRHLKRDVKTHLKYFRVQEISLFVQNTIQFNSN